LALRVALPSVNNVDVCFARPVASLEDFGDNALKIIDH